jgi:cullin 4
MAPSEYIAHIDTRLHQEDARCDRFFERQSKKEVMEIVQRQLITETADFLIEKGFRTMANENETSSIRTLYKLLNLVNDLNLLRTAWVDYIKVSTPRINI